MTPRTVRCDAPIVVCPACNIIAADRVRNDSRPRAFRALDRDYKRCVASTYEHASSSSAFLRNASNSTATPFPRQTCTRVHPTRRRKLCAVRCGVRLAKITIPTCLVSSRVDVRRATGEHIPVTLPIPHTPDIVLAEMEARYATRCFVRVTLSFLYATRPLFISFALKYSFDFLQPAMHLRCGLHSKSHHRFLFYFIFV